MDAGHEWPPISDEAKLRSALGHFEKAGVAVEWPFVSVRPFEHEADPTVFAAFVAVDRDGEQGWAVRGLVARSQEGGIGVRQWTIEPFAFGDSARNIVTSGDMRRIGYGEIINQIINRLGALAWIADVSSQAMEPEYAEWATEAARLSEARPKRGRRPLPAEHYERIARRYIALYDQGWRRGILGEIARLESASQGRSVMWRTVRSWVARARELGYLAHGLKGTVHGAPGPRLIELDKEGDDG